MQNKQKILFLRYADNYDTDCIEQHAAIIREEGYCWYGKTGVIPSKKILNQVFELPEAYILLYRKHNAFLCRVEEYSMRKPRHGIPRYYETEGVFPSIYFKITSIQPCDTVLQRLFVVSTGACVNDIIVRSRIPFMLCEYSRITEGEEGLEFPREEL